MTRAVWAGVAVRLDNGQILTYELAGQEIEFEYEMDREYAELPPWHTGSAFREIDPETYVQRVELTLRGLARRWRGAPTATSVQVAAELEAHRTLPGAAPTTEDQR